MGLSDSKILSKNPPKKPGQALHFFNLFSFYFVTKVMLIRLIYIGRQPHYQCVLQALHFLKI